MKKTDNFLLKIFLLLITFILPFFISEINVSAKVIDYAEVLTNEDSLNEQINKFNELGIDLDVISVTSLDGKNIDKYTDELYHSLYKNAPNKALIVFSPKDRKIRVHTGSNAKKILTDNIANEMVNEVKNDFRNKNYSAGIEKALETGYEKINIGETQSIGLWDRILTISVLVLTIIGVFDAIFNDRGGSNYYPGGRGNSGCNCGGASGGW